MKGYLLRFVCFLMVFATLFGTVAPAAQAAAPVQGTEQKAEKQVVAKKLPDRVGEAVIADSAGVEQKISFFLTPGTQLTNKMFQNLPTGFKLQDVQVRPITAQELQAIEPEFVDTIFDIGSFTLSIYEFQANPSFWNGFWVVMDGAAVVFPGVPAVSGVKRMVEASQILKQSLSYGVRKYSDVQKISMPTTWQRHHIFEKRFAPHLGWDFATEAEMLAIR